MKKKIINLIVKWTGAKKVWDLFDGYKAYIGSVGLILSGVGSLLSSLSGVETPAGLWEFVQGLPQTEGWITTCVGLVGIGARHAIEKNKEKDGE